MADETTQQAQNPVDPQTGTPFPPQFFECVNEYLELTNKQSQKYGEKNISLAALFAAARFNAHVYLTSVKPIAAAEERVPFLDYMTTMYRRMLNEHLDGMGEERGIDVGDSELAEEYKAAGVKIGRLKNADTTAAAANE
ncbi:MAG: DUF3144 domain-containing protein [Thermomonas haemolytica]